MKFPHRCFNFSLSISLSVWFIHEFLPSSSLSCSFAFTPRVPILSLRIQKQGIEKSKDRKYTIAAKSLSSMLDSDISEIRRQRWLQHNEKLQNNDLDTSSSFSSSSSSTTTVLSLPLLPDANISRLSSNQSQSNFNTSDDDDSSRNSRKDCKKGDKVGIAVVRAPPPDTHSEVVTGNAFKIDDKSKETKSCIDLTLSSDDETSCGDGSNSDNGKKVDGNDDYSDKKGSSTNSYESKVGIKNKSNGSNEDALGSECIDSDALPEFSICTYNIWFKETHQSERMKQISSLVSDMKEQKPLFIGLQEVTMTLMQELFPLLESMGYSMICQPDVYHSYGVAIAVLTQPQEEHSSASSSSLSSPLSYVRVVKSGFNPFQESIMGRGLLWVHADIIPRKKDRYLSLSQLSSRTSVLFTTTHLESFLPKHQYPLQDKRKHDGAEARQKQIQESVDFCQKYKKSLLSSSSSSPIQATFITGDLNWDDERKKPADKPLLPIINDSEVSSTNCWVDAWQKLYPAQRGYTYDSKLNPMLKGNLRRRFDRCLYYVENGDSTRRSNDRYSKLQVCSGELIGMEAIEGIQWRKEVSEWKYGKPTGAVTHQLRPVCPSDHFGLYFQFGDASTLESFEANKRSKKRKLNH